MRLRLLSRMGWTTAVIFQRIPWELDFAKAFEPATRIAAAAAAAADGDVMLQRLL